MLFLLLNPLICEMEYIASAAHIKEKPIKSTAVKPSWYTKIPISRLMVGEIYWVKPSTDIGSLLAPLAKTVQNDLGGTTQISILDINNKKISIIAYSVQLEGQTIK